MLFKQNFDGLEHLLKYANKVFDMIAVSETRITKKPYLITNISLKYYAIELTPTESSARTCFSTLLVTYLINHVLILISIRLTS